MNLKASNSISYETDPNRNAIRSVRSTDPNGFFIDPALFGDTIVCYPRLDFEFTGAFKDDQPVLVPVFREGKAHLVISSPGTIVRGTLLNRPATERDCVVVDTGVEAVAVQSPVLSNLVIENNRSCLEFVATPLENHAGKFWWDWEAYEISPNGGRIPVSAPHCELRTAPANEWSREVRDVIMPALLSEIDHLKAKEKKLEWGGEPPPSSETMLEMVKDQFFGRAFRQAKKILFSIELESEAESLAEPMRDFDASGEIENARTLLQKFEDHAAHPLIRHELHLRIRQFLTRQAKLEELLQATRVARSQLIKIAVDGYTLIGQLDYLGRQQICMRRSTMAVSRHLSLPDELTLI